MNKIRRLCKSTTIFYLVSLLIAATSFDVSGAEPAAGKKDYTIVIDAGHGGKDVGAADNGVFEKDINLAVAQKLGNLIKKKLKNVDVVYTRDDDRYLTLQERADAANKSKGDLFISIHTNSVDKSNKNRTTVEGASVYTLGLHKDDNNRAVARRENAVIELESDYERKYSGFDPDSDESYIIFELAQKNNLGQSIRFAQDVQKNMVQKAGRKDRGVHQAGFWVLWATSMPSVLIELDFICNPNSAKYLSSNEGQTKLAESIYDGVAAFIKRAENRSKGIVDASDLIEVEPEEVEDNIAVLSASNADKERKTIAPTSTEQKAASSTKRRRRSLASREASISSPVEETNIALTAEQTAEEKTLAAVSEPEPTPQPTTTTQTPKKAEQKSKSADSKKNDGKHHAKIQKVKTVYKIQVLASAEELKTNSPRFCGLKPISMFKEGNLYKYTYGESEDPAKIKAMLEEVRKKIPDAFVIKSTKNAKN